MRNKYRSEHWSSVFWVFWLTLLSFTQLQAQAVQPPVIQWQQLTEPGSGGEVRLAKANDGGYVVLSSWVGRLVRLSATGEIKWQVQIPTSSSFKDVIYKSTGLVATKDGGFIVLAQDDYGWYLTKVDANGNGIWAKAFDSFEPHGNLQRIKKHLIQTADGSLLVAGYTSFPRFPTQATVEKFDQDGNYVWSHTYRYDGYDVYVRETTVATRIVEVSGGNYVVTGATIGDDTQKYPQRAWAAKLDRDGSVLWQQRYENRLLLDDIAVSPYTDQLYVASGVNNLNSAITNSLNIHAEGNDGGGYYQPGRVVGSNSAIASIKATNGLPAYHTLLDVSDQNSGDFRINALTTNNELLWTKTIGGSGEERAYAILATDDGGYLVAGTTTSTDGDVQGKTDNQVATWLVKLGPASPPNALTLTQPTYNCQTGAITFNTSGGDGSPITYMAPGITRAALTDNFGTVEQGLRNDPKPILIQATQSGRTVSYTFDFGAYCSNPPAHPDLGPLVDLYNSTNGPGWTTRTTWLQDNNPCGWYGVTCNGNGRVERLQLDGNNLKGTLPASLGNLSELASLYLVNNQLTGEIPASLGKLSKLNNLFLHTNQLSGSIPASLGNLTQLKNLGLSFNQLSGSIPASLGKLTQLLYLELANNQLVGPIPGDLGNLSQLAILYLHKNQLSGCIPAELSALCGRDVRIDGNAGLSGGGDFNAFCANKTGACSTNSLLTLTQPTYNCQTGAITFNTAGGDGSPITYTAPGITRAALTDNFGTVERELRNDPKPILIQATQSGRTVSYTFDFGAYCNNPKPPTSSTLVLVAPTYNCQTGAITFNTTGGDGSPIEFRAAGITEWTTNPNQFVDKESRTANDVQPFMLMARQSGSQVSYSWDLKAACGRARVGVDEVGSGLSLRVLGNPAGEQLRVLIEGVEGEAVELELSDVNGRLVERRRLESSGAHEEHVFSLEKSGSKLLLLRAATTQQSKTVRIIKQ